MSETATLHVSFFATLLDLIAFGSTVQALRYLCKIVWYDGARADLLISDGSSWLRLINFLSTVLPGMASM